MMPFNDKHSSKSYDSDIEDVINAFIDMGRRVTDQVTDATHSLIDNDKTIADKVILEDENINQLEVKIDEMVILLVAKRQPTAKDLRLVMALSKGVVDLERIGDEASKIARMASQLIEHGELPRGYSEVQHLSNQVRLMLLDALDAFTHMNAEQAFTVLQNDSFVNEDYQSAARSLMTYVMEDSRHVTKVINLLWVLKALERVGDHARNIAELVIFCSSGENVRHADFVLVEQAVQKAARNMAPKDGNNNDGNSNGGGS